MILRLWAYGILACLLAPSASSQTVDLASRTFWVGERPKTIDGEPPFIAVREIDWIEAALSVDPVLKDAVIHIEYAYMSVKATVASANDGEILLGQDRVRPAFSLPDYRIYGSAVRTSKSYTYVPIDPDAGFAVYCGERDDGPHMSVCVVYATYLPDDRIRLKARLYFPPDPMDSPTLFRDVAERMRDVAYCLDVSERMIDVPEVRPSLSGCRPDEVS
jgi:hypothetical protein